MILRFVFIEERKILLKDSFILKKHLWQKSLSLKNCRRWSNTCKVTLTENIMNSKRLIENTKMLPMSDLEFGAANCVNFTTSFVTILENYSFEIRNNELRKSGNFFNFVFKLCSRHLTWKRNYGNIILCF